MANNTTVSIRSVRTEITFEHFVIIMKGFRYDFNLL